VHGDNAGIPGAGDGAAAYPGETGLGAAETRYRNTLPLSLTVGAESIDKYGVEAVTPSGLLEYIESLWGRRAS